MGMHVHEVHAAAVHAPLVLLPAAAIVDLAAAVSGDKRQAALGGRLGRGDISPAHDRAEAYLG